MITDELNNKIDRTWDAFLSGGISDPLEAIEHIAYLLFIRRLDDQQTLEERKASRTSKPLEREIFQPGQADLRLVAVRERRARRHVPDRRGGHHRGRRPALWTPGDSLAIDWG